MRLKRCNRTKEKELNSSTLNQPRVESLEDSTTMLTDQSKTKSYSTFIRKVSAGPRLSDTTEEEMLSTIKEDTSYYLDDEPIILNVAFRAVCEKVSLGGIVYGYLEIADSKKILFSPSLEERPDDKSFPFGTLVSISEGFL